MKMRLSEALAILNTPPPANAAEFRASLVCGFAPLHLKTFMAARLRQTLPNFRIAVEAGLYGDLLGNLERVARDKVDCIAIVLEWQDLDQRLGLRSLAGWNQSGLDDILDTVRVRLSACRETIERIPPTGPVAVCLPTLPLPPLQPTAAAWNASLFELQVQESLSAFAFELAGRDSIKVANTGWLNRISPVAERFDAKSELLDGFPYTLKHTSAVSEILTKLIHNPSIKKGLITDLDNTLWRGLVGEIGPEGVSWNLDQNSHMYAVYQELLRSLASAGVLVAVASKNDPALVQQVFQRTDIILGSDNIFPFEVHWAQNPSRYLAFWKFGMLPPIALYLSTIT
jgi:predicted enzyme involved in methoxymalonyl-ACP biosynthesis